jgi:hypothetical protein
MTEVSQFFELLLKALIDIAVPVLAYAAYSWLLTQSKRVEANMTAEQRAEFNTLIKVVVQAAEQAGLKGVILNEGKVKKQWAIDTLQAAAASRGITISVAEIAAAIEQAIYQGVHKDRMAFITAEKVDIGQVAESLKK